MNEQEQLLQNLATESDFRTTAVDYRWWVAVNGAKAHVGTFATGDVEVDNDWIDVRFEVCPACEGEGKYVNPSIDAHGLSPSDFEGPDFEESYFRGDYDTRCVLCQGEKVVPVPLDPEILKEIEERARSNAESRAEMLAEMRTGA